MSLQQSLLDMAVPTESASLSEPAAVPQTGAYIPNGDASSRAENEFLRNRISRRLRRAYGGVSVNREVLPNGVSSSNYHGEASGQDVNHAEPRLNGASHDDESIEDSIMGLGEGAGSHGDRPRVVPRIFPAPVQVCRDHSHPHPHRGDHSVRVPDGRQCFTVTLTVMFRDTKITYARTFASMTSMTEMPEHNNGLFEDDFRHLYRLMEVRLDNADADLYPLGEGLSPAEHSRLSNRYTVNVELATGDHPERVRVAHFTQDLRRGLIAPQEAKSIIGKLEDIVLHAIETMDDLVEYREMRRVSANYDLQAIYDPRSVIADFEARRAVRQEKKYEWRIAMLQSTNNMLVHERDADDAERNALGRSNAASPSVFAGHAELGSTGDGMVL